MHHYCKLESRPEGHFAARDRIADMSFIQMRAQRLAGNHTGGGKEGDRRRRIGKTADVCSSGKNSVVIRAIGGPSGEATIGGKNSP